MKTRSSTDLGALAAALGTALLTCLPLPLVAQGVPLAISYQAVLTDDAGAPLSPGVPTNYPVEFRIFDTAELGTLIWAEAQNISVFEGSFSTLLGTGDAIGEDPRPQLDLVFDNEMRYLEITITDTGAQKTFTPRQRLVTAPFAFRASTAENALRVADGSVSTNKISGGSVTLAKLAANSVDASKITANAVTSSEIAGGAVTGEKIAAGAVDIAGLAAAVANRLVPAGSVTAWAGIPTAQTIDGTVLGGVPDGWVLCDGSKLSPAEYPELFKAIGYIYGGEETPFFQVPDYRGYFLRGQGSSTIDPNSGSRTHASGWAEANALNEGSTQTDAFEKHRHSEDEPVNAAYAAIDTALTTATRTSKKGDTYTGYAGGDETRPVNRYAWYIIKAH